MFDKIKLVTKLDLISLKLVILETKIQRVPIFWNYQYMKLPEESRKEIMGWLEEQYALGIESANILLKLKKYKEYKLVLQDLKRLEDNIANIKYMCLQEGVTC